MLPGDLEDACRNASEELVLEAARLNIGLSETQRDSFARYCSFLLDANSRTNLTALRTPDAAMRGLFLDSLSIAIALPEGTISSRGSCIRMVDVGSGAGIPGVPIKILLPRARLTLVESIGKKAAFLEALVRELALEDVEVKAARAEDLATTAPLRDSADLCMARAVAPLPTLLELCAPFVCPGGMLLLPKIGALDAELKSARAAERALHTSLERVVAIPDEVRLGHGRVVLAYRKLSPTPSGYPRRVGLARTRPIGFEAQRKPA